MNKLLRITGNSLNLNRFLFARMSSTAGYLINEPKYAFLKKLGLQETNLGVFNGKWFADGEVSKDFQALEEKL